MQPRIMKWFQETSQLLSLAAASDASGRAQPIRGWMAVISDSQSHGGNQFNVGGRPGDGIILIDIPMDGRLVGQFCGQ